MQDRLNASTMATLSRMAVLLAFLLFLSPPAWSRSGIDTDIFGQVLQEAHSLFAANTEGANADYIPELAKVDAALFGLALVTADGKVYTAGDAEHVFTIQSVSKPFTAALVMREHGDAKVIAEKIGLEPTGLPFNSVLALELLKARSVNPLVNAGAIAAVSLILADTPDQGFDKIKGFYETLAGEELDVVEEVYRSEASTNQGNRAIAYLLHRYDRIYADPMESVDVYTKQCSIGVNARQLAIMGATLANGGINPVSKQQVLDAEYVPRILALMLTAGFYDESGAWAFNVGLPAKTGVGGGILAVAPAKLAVAAFSPRLNQSGNSIRAMRAIAYVSQRLGLGLFQ
ncbi:Glutaminase 1 [Thiorhodovibrio winogradskyi]|uniref:Glutaminase n=1 Tax=Thiorhodovibrio winogradskyi TaxID=77007 RepID=A0ABZ0SI47_9GAMM|nr:glutaminase A [Thiorhodovibrio winogradskyi]